MISSRVTRSVLPDFMSPFKQGEECLDGEKRTLQVMGHGIGEPVQFGVLLLQFADEVLPLFFCLFAFGDVPCSSEHTPHIPVRVLIHRCIVENRDRMPVPVPDLKRIIDDMSP